MDSSQVDVRSSFPDGIPSGAATVKTPATSTARHVPYLLAFRVVRVRVRPERHRAQSCAIALRSPAPERSSNDIHQLFTYFRVSRFRGLGRAFLYLSIYLLLTY